MSMLFSLHAQQTVLQQADSLCTIGQEASAISILKNQLNKQRTPNVLEKLGDLYGAQKQWNNAIIYYKELAETYPKSANYHYKYGGVLGMKALENKLAALGIVGDIESEFKTAASLDAKHVDVRWALVKFYVELPGILGGSYKKAHHYANELKHISTVDYHLTKGFIYEASNDDKDAEKHYKEAVKIGSSALCYTTLITFYLEQSKYAQAYYTAKQAYLKLEDCSFLSTVLKIASEEKIYIDEALQLGSAYVKTKECSATTAEKISLYLKQLNKLQNP